MKILVIADMDDFHWQHNAGHADILLSCGDISDQVIVEAAKASRCKAVFAVKGNHDHNTPFPGPIVDLHLQRQEYGGIRFGGFNGSWKYKPRGHFLYEQSEVEDFIRGFPAVDVFVSHNSPLGIHDRQDGIHFGFAALNTYIDNARPKLLIHGHQHVDKETTKGSTRVIGVYGWKVLEI